MVSCLKVVLSLRLLGIRAARSGLLPVLVLLLVAGCSGGSKSADTTTAGVVSEGPALTDWTVVLDDVRLMPVGIGMALHPTREPVLVAATSRVPLEVCPADAMGRPSAPQLSSFGRRWTACLPLGSQPVELPVTDGLSHVGFRVRPLERGDAGVSQVRVRWTCQDTYFVLDDPTGALRPPAPGCGSAPEEVR